MFDPVFPHRARKMGCGCSRGNTCNFSDRPALGTPLLMYDLLPGLKLRHRHIILGYYWCRRRLVTGNAGTERGMPSSGAVVRAEEEGRPRGRPPASIRCSIGGAAEHQHHRGGIRSILRVLLYAQEPDLYTVKDLAFRVLPASTKRHVHHIDRRPRPPLSPYLHSLTMINKPVT